MTTEKQRFINLQKEQCRLRQDLVKKLLDYGEERPITDPAILRINQEITVNRLALFELQARLVQYHVKIQK